MFLESTSNRGKRRGWIEVICGSMFSGKTEELIRRMKRAQFARQSVEIFKPVLDVRYSEEEVVSHKGSSIHSTPIQHSSQLLLLTSDVEVVGIDEAQFFDDGLPDAVNELANSGIRVIAAGLDLDFKGRPFGPMPHLLAIAEYVTKVHAVCVKTGNLAHYSYRFNSNDDLVALGEQESYIPLSREAYMDAQVNPEAMNKEAREWKKWQDEESQKREERKLNDLNMNAEEES
tara:strand:- start:192 stop:884 length:693 start_codon:yes stop_codon:yes gene_type:complete